MTHMQQLHLLQKVYAKMTVSVNICESRLSAFIPSTKCEQIDFAREMNNIN